MDAAKTMNVSNGETLHNILEQLEATDFCDCNDDFELLLAIAAEVARIKRNTFHYIDFADGEFG